MTKLKFIVPIVHLPEKLAQRALEVLNDTSFSWKFFSKECLVQSHTLHSKKHPEYLLSDIKSIERQITLFPDNKALREEHKRAMEKYDSEWEYDIQIIYETDIQAEVDIETNDICFYDGPQILEKAHRALSCAKSHIQSDVLDEFYYDKIKKLVLAIIMSYVLATPDLVLRCASCDVYFDDILYRRDNYILYANQNDSFQHHADLMKTNITFDQTINWIKANTSLYDENAKSPIAFSALTYILNREYHESLLYSIIGLESIFTPGGKGISITLQKRINHIFPTITAEQIKKLYQMRSKFVHGEIRIGNYQLLEEIGDDMDAFESHSTLATALLIESIRLLIANNATKFSFIEVINHQYC